MLFKSDKYYKAFFCEENCWQLLNSLPQKIQQDFYVLFLTNPTKSIALSQQKAAPENELIIWDYHVILFNWRQKLIYDMDSRLDFPEKASKYHSLTFPPSALIHQDYQTFIRPVKATQYLQCFHSERHHMLDHEGKPLQEFPDWPCLLSDTPIYLHEFLSFNAQNPKLAPFITPKEALNLQY